MIKKSPLIAHSQNILANFATGVLLMCKAHIIPGKLLISSLQLQKEKILQMEK